MFQWVLAAILDLILAALAYLNPSIYKNFINEVFCNIETVVLGSGAGSAIHTKDS